MTKPESKLCLIKFELDIDVIIFNCGFKNDLRICTTGKPIENVTFKLF